MSRARVSVPSLEPHTRPRGRCFIVCSFHARFTPSTTMNSLSRGFRAGGISDYTCVCPKVDRAVIARSLTLIGSYDIEASSPVLSRSIRYRGFSYLNRARILFLFLQSDRMINTSAARDDFRRAFINEGQMYFALYSQWYKAQQKCTNNVFNASGNKLLLLI